MEEEETTSNFFAVLFLEEVVEDYLEDYLHLSRVVEAAGANRYSY